MSELIKTIKKRIEGITGHSVQLDEILESGFSFDVKTTLTSDQYDKIDALVAEFGVEIFTFH